MAARSISPGFLREIDQFLCAHPEIASCAEGRDMLRALSRLSPLEAYKYFLRGYTRPARYIDGIIKTEYFRPALDFTWCPLRKKYDSELVEFFDGFDYRHDIIDCIDREVHIGIQRLTFGRPVSVSLRKLISYSLWGNPVDAYKFFEYSYQQDFLPHRYVSEHVVLGHIPQSKYYSEPQPSDVGGWRRHGYVRSRMARARDQGVGKFHLFLITIIAGGQKAQQYVIANAFRRPRCLDR
ncbi:hypothetical protein BKA66DRAFT_584329 [Pyrenochaeta sp. MPI-SDFR-AT-0127]|nr:hypothetical protein BKA66DRAFT_584329 [Pyrenochaeta sp. MPI-SDFR-AT-0127]